MVLIHHTIHYVVLKRNFDSLHFHWHLTALFVLPNRIICFYSSQINSYLFFFLFISTLTLAGKKGCQFFFLCINNNYCCNFKAVWQFVELNLLIHYVYPLLYSLSYPLIHCRRHTLLLWHVLETIFKSF